METDTSIATGVTLFVGGLFLLGWGYPLMRAAMALAGLLLGAVLGWELCRALGLSGWLVYLAMAVGAGILAALMPLVRRAGMFVLGTAAGWGMVTLFAGPGGEWPMIAVHAAAGLVGGLAIFFLERIVLIVATSYLGALVMVTGFGTVTGIGLQLSDLTGAGASGTEISWKVVLAVLALTGLGIGVQLARSKRKRRG